MDTKIMGPRDLAFLLSEGSGQISRDVVVIGAGAGKLPPGLVLGEVTASGKFVPATATEVAGSEGAETARAVLAYGVDATDEDVPAVVIRRLAEVKKPLLVFGSTIDNAARQEAAIAQLAAAHIIAR